ncbi:MAG: four-carbon acid sugar kinase family protein [Verrucomicrobiia bacterium]
MTGAVKKAQLFATLPPPWPEDLRPQIRAAVASQPSHKLIVLDDDPTGTQTVHDVPVLTVWDVDTLRAELAQSGPCFYILTNSRSLPADRAGKLIREIAGNLRETAGSAAFQPPSAGQPPCGRWKAAVPFTLVSRSDSTLRGHYQLETDALAEELGPFAATILIPYFEAGGRYTMGDVHYVAEGDVLVPAAETPFARDAAFGYRSSNLRDYVEEKTTGRVKAAEVASISLDDLRRGGPATVTKTLQSLPASSVCVVNAAATRDLEVFVAGLVEAEAHGRRYLFRTAAQFVAARLGLEPRPLWQPLGTAAFQPPVTGRRLGGLTVVGSYVPKTTAQVDALLANPELERVEICVADILQPERKAAELKRVVAQTNQSLAAGRDVVVFTSRALITGHDAAASLDIGAKVSEGLVEVVRQIDVRPRYLIAKGGITSSDLATKGLGVKRARVLGQILPGVPVWELGPETKFPGLLYVVFPGNVGGPEALQDAVQEFKT